MFLSFYLTTLRGFWRLYLNPQDWVGVNQSVSSCDCRSWVHYLPIQGHIRLSSPKQWILEMARDCASQSQALTVFEVKLKIQPLFRSQTRQATTVDSYRGCSGRDAYTHVSKTQHCTIAAFSCVLLPLFSTFSWNFLQIFIYFTFILKC